MKGGMDTKRKTSAKSVKRGRKPKQDVSTTAKTKSDRSKKKKEKSYSVTTVEQTIEVPPPSENIILHLPVHSEDLDNVTDGGPQPQEMETSGLAMNHATWVNDVPHSSNSGFAQYPFQRDNEILEVLDEGGDGGAAPLSITGTADAPATWALKIDTPYRPLENWNRNFRVDTSIPVEYNKKTDTLMKPFIEANHRGEWPKSTPIHCFWCCHPFDGAPCALPVNHHKGEFRVYGCFCSPECAAAYNFNDFQDTDNRWERYSLLNLMVKKLYNNQGCRIKLAPPRQTLDIFGGPLSIGQFRQTLDHYGKTYVVNMPPLTSIHAQQEQINFDSNPYGKRDASLFIPVDNDRVSEASENLKLRRKKPVSDAKNTLESCMNLQFR